MGMGDKSVVKGETKKEIVKNELRKGFHSIFSLTQESGAPAASIRRIVKELRDVGYEIRGTRGGYEMVL